MLKDRRQYFFLAITLLFVIVSFLDRLISKGMFFDGVIYASISRNMAIGKGSFWAPYYFSEYLFWEHPPLMFGIESVFFKIFGDHYYTEKIFSFAVWLCTVLLLRKLWNTNSKEPQSRAGYWLALLFWGIAPTVLWSYPNNLLDAMMCLFDLAAFVVLFSACRNGKFSFASISFAAFFIFCATLTKGPVGIFPVAVPFLYYLVYRQSNMGKAFLNSCLLFVLVAIAYVVLWQVPAPHNELKHYLDEQLFKALAGHREMVESPLGRFALIPEIGLQLLPAIVLCIVIFLCSKWLKPVVVKSSEHRSALFFIICGACASLPIMVSIKQSSFYLLPALPYYATGLGLLMYPYMMALANKYTLPINARNVLNILLLIACVGCIPYLWSKTEKMSRDEELQTDLQTFSKVMPDKEKISICNNLKTDYPFCAYAERFHQWEIIERKDTRFLVSDGSCGAGFEDSIKNEGFMKLNLPVKKYTLYQRNP